MGASPSHAPGRELRVRAKYSRSSGSIIQRACQVKSANDFHKALADAWTQHLEAIIALRAGEPHGAKVESIQLGHACNRHSHPFPAILLVPLCSCSWSGTCQRYHQDAVHPRTTYFGRATQKNTFHRIGLAAVCLRKCRGGLHWSL